MISLTNIMPWIWLGILILSCIVEAITFSLTSIWAAIAALPLIFISKTPLDIKWQLLIFVVLTTVLVIFTRPFAVKKLKIGKNKTNVDSIIGQEVLVTKSIKKFDKGLVKAKNGVIWTAKSKNDSEIEKGSNAIVISVEGNTLTIELI